MSVYEKLVTYYQSVGRNDKAYHIQCIRENQNSCYFLKCMFEIETKI